MLQLPAVEFPLASQPGNPNIYSQQFPSTFCDGIFFVEKKSTPEGLHPNIQQSARKKGSQDSPDKKGDDRTMEKHRKKLEGVHMSEKLSVLHFGCLFHMFSFIFQAVRKPEFSRLSILPICEPKLLAGVFRWSEKFMSSSGNSMNRSSAIK